MTTNLSKSLLIAALIASASAHAADDTITVTVKNGKPHATFQLAGSRCVLVDDQIRCTSTPVVVADNDR
ncbi:MAG: hypothetical protein C5B46_07405 [Proteobacteria bacterium]|nr:MAG: hypothetical protein C5B46_07405 [Pseudomonadota bacterium]